MPMSSAAFFLLRTYIFDGAKSPTRTTARAGVTPVVVTSAWTPLLTSARTLAATARPSRISTARDSAGEGNAQTLDRQAPAGFGIDPDDGAVQGGGPFGGLEAVRHLGE